MSKRRGMILLLCLCLLFVGYIYFRQDPQDETSEDVYLMNVVFKDEQGDLIPVKINFYNEVDLEESVRNRITFMQTDDLIAYGLYPVLNEQLKIQDVYIENEVLTVDFNNELYNSHPLDILEALTYTLTDYDGVQQLQLTIDGEYIQYLPNSNIPLSSLTKDLGLNNFEETSALLHQTIPVMVYQNKTIQDFQFYVPTTIRIDETESLFSQVQTILNYVESKIHLLDVQLQDHTLTIELDSNILLDNETIDKTLEDLIVLSLSSLKNVENVNIQVNGEDVSTKKSSQIEYNYVKL